VPQVPMLHLWVLTLLSFGVASGPTSTQPDRNALVDQNPHREKRPSITVLASSNAAPAASGSLPETALETGRACPRPPSNQAAFERRPESHEIRATRSIPRRLERSRFPLCVAFRRHPLRIPAKYLIFAAPPSCFLAMRVGVDSMTTMVPLLLRKFALEMAFHIFTTERVSCFGQ
jgi:hypothetical protein